MIRPLIEKLGTIACDLVETTPLVFRNRLYRFECVRVRSAGRIGSGSYFRFVDTTTGTTTASFAEGFHLGCAYAESDTVYAYGVNAWGAPDVHVFWSTDLEHWSSQPALQTPGWGLYNTSVCRGRDRYIMAVEAGEPTEVVGVRFTNFFAESKDLIHWRLMDLTHVFDRARYTACPTIRYCDGHYYVSYLHETRAGAGVSPVYETHIVRTRDLIHWESSPYSPILRAGDEDRRLASDCFTAAERERIASAVNVNNSDVDLCEHNGEVVISYSWGNQHGTEHLAIARYRGSLESFLKGYFPAFDGTVISETG